MLKVQFKDTIGFSGARKDKLLKAGALLEKVLNSEEFKKAVLNFSWSITYSTGWWKWKQWHTEGDNKFRWNFYTDEKGIEHKDLSNQQIYDRIMQGQNIFESQPNAIMEISETLSNQKGVLGWTNPSTTMEWISQWFFDSAEVYEIAGNLGHEQLHKIGFDHEFNWTSTRDYTAVYAIGNIIETIAQKMWVMEK